jgi:rhamnosyltransferase
MMAADLSPIRVGELASVTVTFNPDIALLERQLLALSEVARIIVVDNASEPASREALRRLVSTVDHAVLIENAQNIGLAGALNAGIARARSPEMLCRAVLLLDQDSVFSVDTPNGLVTALNQVQAATGVLCCVGPVLVDPGTGLPHGFHHVEKEWRWARAYPGPDAKPFPLANLNGSGTTMMLELVAEIGDLDAAMFIDHVDTEWSFRVTSRGFGLFGIPWLSFDHRMGERGRRFWLFGWRVWPERSPLRHFYLYRNTIWLLRRGYVPLVWKAWAVVKMMLTLMVVMLSDPRRGVQLRMIWKGIRTGMQRVAR